MENLSPWIEHLNKPLVLSAFVLWVLAGLIKLLKPEKLNGKATERLLDKFMTLAFAMGSLMVLLAIAIGYLQTPSNPPSVATQPTTDQSIRNRQGTAGQVGHDLNINVVGSPAPSQGKPPRSSEQPTIHLKQQINDSTGIQAQGGRDVTIHSHEK